MKGIVLNAIAYILTVSLGLGVQDYAVTVITDVVGVRYGGRAVSLNGFRKNNTLLVFSGTGRYIEEERFA